MKQLFVLFVFMVLWVIPNSYGHHPYEVSYFFTLDKQELIIHLTPKSAVDLLKSIRKDLAKEHVIALADYEQEFEAYFQRHIHLKLGDRRVRLLLKQADLTQHDSSLHFALEEIPADISAYSLNLTAFNTVYGRIRNHVALFTDGQKQRHILTASSTTVSGNFEGFGKMDTSPNSKLFSLGILAILITSGLVIGRKFK